jgi:3-deoxy-manno-octulosonate cytidylyltransferase (CMP-KDO synthetase)
VTSADNPAVPSRIVIIVPARWGSKRFPGKPLALVAGKSVLARTLAIARAVPGVDAVYVATDDTRIAAAAQHHGVQALITLGEHATGTDRVAAAADMLTEPADAVVNLQGDALLTPPWVITPVVQALARGEALVTPAVRLDRARYDELVAAKKSAPASGTTVTLDKDGWALYFSKHVLPFVRDARAELPPVFRHIGIYGYARAALRDWASLPQSALERAEGLEQLRALENGRRMKVVEVDYRGRTHWSIDAPEDVALAEGIIGREGELV